MPFNSLNFKYPWRNYQLRVLNAIDEHLSDDRLHIVAAPGAGKTTLGLEVFRKLEKNTLVLSPTRVIRDQWLNRLSDFTAIPIEELDWTSKDITQPKTLTSSTYQALHAKFSESLSDDESEDIDSELIDEALDQSEVKRFIEILTDNKIEVLILDEAHHLKAEWWKALDKVASALSNLTIVSLTATPPYDSQGHEWIRYESLCGPIDEEISVPELVKAKTLCPHQDYIWAVDVSSKEKEKIREYDQRVSLLCNSLIKNADFNQIVQSHPWISKQQICEQAAKEPEFAMALLVYLKATYFQIPETTLTQLDIELVDIPELGRKWWQVLIKGVLFSSTFEFTKEQEVFVDKLKKQLRASELLYKRELSLERSRRMERSLSLSSSKIKGCVDVHKLENRYRKASLRQVVLTDYIRDEKLDSEINAGELSLGAWPIFRGIVAETNIPQFCALLTGRLSIIHKQTLQTLLSLLDESKTTYQPYKGSEIFYQVSAPLNQLTKAYTNLLMKGEIRVLVGTRSLLGEGWDAPVVNSLILASSVGSFMLTNQMRGRAIRKDKNDPKKASSIWHLVAIDTKSMSGFRDYNNLVDRFETFVGLSEKQRTIESGISRVRSKALASYGRTDLESHLYRINNWEMMRRYRKYRKLIDRWESALTVQDSARVIPSVKTETVKGLRAYHFKHSLSHLIVQLATALIGVVGFTYFFAKKPQLAALVLAVGSVAVLLYRLPKTFKIIRSFLFHLPPDGSLKQIGTALAHALCQVGLIKTSFRRLKVSTEEADDGTFFLGIAGCSFYESSLFADCVNEILSPIENPRYIVVREGSVYGLKRDDYHAVPMKLGSKKENAQIFYQSWARYVGPSELIYTRTSEGRSLLAKARIKAFSNLFKNKLKRLDRWS